MRYIMWAMIKSFHDKETAAAFIGLSVRRFPVELRRRIRQRLDQLHAATTLDFLRSPPGNRLEALHGDRSGQYSIRINDQWRVCFEWRDGNVWEVEIVWTITEGKPMTIRIEDLPLIDFSDVVDPTVNDLPPIHPGEILREDFLAPLGLSVNALALALHVPATRLHEIVKERRGQFNSSSKPKESDIDEGGVRCIEGNS